MSKLSQRDNKLRAIRFQKPDYIPMIFHVNNASYEYYGKEYLYDLMEKHKLLFPNFDRNNHKIVYGNCEKKDEPYLDDFGCTWYTTVDGIVGTVLGHPLDEIEKIKDYKFPDPEKVMGIGKIDWQEELQNVEKEHQEGKFVERGLRHGHTFLQACDIRGYEDLLIDMMYEEEYLPWLFDNLYNFNAAIIDKYCHSSVDMITIPEDLGMQIGPMIDVDNFLKYIYPSYVKMIKKCKEHNKIVHMHSDGDIKLLAEYLIDNGVDVLNLQDMVVGIEWIKENLKGKVCLEVDIDRQDITFRGTPEEIDKHIYKIVSELSSEDGGLMLIYGLYPNVPKENIEQLMDSMEKYMYFYSDNK